MPGFEDVKVVVADVDGTLTRSRGDLHISLEAIAAVRGLEASGVRVALVSGNSIPVMAALARYLGATGPVVAENGCVGFYEGRLVHLADGRPPSGLVEELRRLGLRESWQNPFRFHDVAFLASPGGPGPGEVEAVVSRYPGFKVIYSGYAYHIAPEECSKRRGLEWAVGLLGYSPKEALAIGDGENDLDMLVAAGVSAAPGDAAEPVRKAVDYVARSPGGRGFAEIAATLIEALRGRRSRG